MSFEPLAFVIANTSVVFGNRWMSIGDDLIIADLHLGKTMHFRKAGLPIPPSARFADQSALLDLIHSEQPKRLVILGDLFHSALNSEMEEFGMITRQFPEIDFLLVIGNHDILSDSNYRSLDLQVFETLMIGPFLLSHEPLDSMPVGEINIHGHIHPGVLLKGRGRQSLMVPCFHLQGQHLCMPAFGALTGLMKVKTKKKDSVFGVLEAEVVQLM